MEKEMVNCGIVSDLLPLYVDEVCSPESREAVEGHLAGCVVCRKKLEQMQKQPWEESMVQPDNTEEPVMKSSFRKIKRRWMLSLCAVLLLIPMVCLGGMCANQYRGEGMCFTNLDDIATAKSFLKKLEQKQYARAAEQISFQKGYETIVNYEKEVLSTDFIAVKAAGETWMVNGFWPQYDIEKGELDVIAELEKGEDEFWHEMIYGYEIGIPIPETIWDDIVGENTVPERNSRQDVYYAGEGSPFVYNQEEQGFGRYETEWGTYYIAGSVFEDLPEMDREEQLVLFYREMKMMPEQIYQDVMAYIPEYLDIQNANFEDYYGEVLSMTEEEYVEEMQKRFVQSMEKYEAMGYSFTDSSFADAYYDTNDRTWTIVLSITETSGSGMKARATLQLKIFGGQVDIVAGSVFGYERMRGLVDQMNVRWKK